MVQHDGPAFRQAVRALIAEFKPGGADLLPALHTVQHEYGYLPRADFLVRVDGKPVVLESAARGVRSFLVDTREFQGE